MSSNSRIMKEFWGMIGSFSWVFFIGVLVGILMCLYAQNTPEEPRPTINIEKYQPQPGYIPEGLKP